MDFHKIKERVAVKTHSVNNCKYSDCVNLYAFHGNNIVMSVRNRFNELYVL